MPELGLSTRRMGAIIDGYKRVRHSSGAFNRWGGNLGFTRRAAAGILKAVDFSLVVFKPQGTKLENIRNKLVGPSPTQVLLAVNQAWKKIRNNIEPFDPRVNDEKTAFLLKLSRALTKVFADLDRKVVQGKIDPLVRLDLLRFSPEEPDPGLYDAERMINVGFFSVTANPLNWGHFLAPLKSLTMLELDTIVFRSQGEINYKTLPPHEQVSAKARHYILKEVLAGLSPLARYTDMGSEPGNNVEGAEEMHRFMQLNAHRQLHIHYLIGAESEARMENYMRQQYQMMKKYEFGNNPGHRISFSVIQRVEYGKNVTLAELQAISRRIKAVEGWQGEELDIELIKDPEIDLNVNSTQYRSSPETSYLVPLIVHKLVQQLGLYRCR